ncbi:FabZ [Flavobacterium sp. JRM]|nr:FabZ [Flavobacterium sp. JRM]
MTKPILDKEAVENLLPQKFPFVMVDKMFSFDESSLVAGLKIQSENIFSENGIFLEAGLIEHMAQSVALHTGYVFFLKQKKAPTGYIGSIKQIDIKKLPSVNDEIQSTITIIQEFAGITLVDIVTTLNNEEIANGQMKTVLAK